MKRVVITGVGAITPVGNNAEEFWQGLVDGKCGIDKISLFDTTNFKVTLAAEVKNYNPEEFLNPKEIRKMDRYVQFAMIAAKEAYKDSNIDIGKIDNTRFGVAIGSGIGGLTTMQNNILTLGEKGPGRISPHFIPMSISNMASGNVAIELNAKGESFCTTTACASATHAIGESFRIIRHGYQDIMITGGTEAAINEIGIAGFQNIKALHTGEDKNRASIPFDKERSGFVMGEGAGILVLEELEHAKARGAKIYAEVVGFGSTTDAYHITAPDPEGNGGALAMINAMKDANITPDKVNYINAHGTSTKLNEAGETKAVKKAFGDDYKNVYVSSTKGHTGHLLGAAGGIEAVACVKAIENATIPQTINYKIVDEECDLNLVVNEAKKANLEYVMSNSLGFGGHNSSIILKKYQD